MKRLYPRHRIDLEPAQLLSGLAGCLTAWDATALAAAVEARWSSEGDALATLSVRSAFDLLLSALALPPGSELVLSQVTIPDMAMVARAHGLTVVPLPIRPDTLAPPAGALERVLTPRTGAVVVAHLFGGRMDLAPLLEVCGRRGLPLVEDCAQAYAGPIDSGHPGALASLFSFGAIKTATALGGALTRVREPALLARMRALQAAWPRQPRTAYAARLPRFLALGALRSPGVFGALLQLCEAAGVDWQALLASTVKGFPGGPEAALAALRRQPSAPLLALLSGRLARFDEARLHRRALLGERIRAVAGARLCGTEQAARTHWLCPILSEEPAAFIAALREAGFDAAQGTTSLVELGVPPGAGFLRKVVYLPAYPELEEADVERLLAVLPRWCGAEPIGHATHAAAPHH